MTAKKPTPPAAPATYAVKASVPKRPVIQHAKLLTATLQAEHRKAQGALQEADMALSLAAQERDDAINLANARFDAIREGLDQERADIIRTIDGIEAGLKAMAPQADNVVPLASGEAA
jgi:hypothetical protein